MPVIAMQQYVQETGRIAPSETKSSTQRQGCTGLSKQQKRSAAGRSKNMSISSKKTMKRPWIQEIAAPFPTSGAGFITLGIYYGGAFLPIVAVCIQTAIDIWLHFDMSVALATCLSWCVLPLYISLSSGAFMSFLLRSYIGSCIGLVSPAASSIETCYQWMGLVSVGLVGSFFEVAAIQVSVLLGVPLTPKCTKIWNRKTARQREEFIPTAKTLIG